MKPAALAFKFGSSLWQGSHWVARTRTVKMYGLAVARQPRWSGTLTVSHTHIYRSIHFYAIIYLYARSVRDLTSVVLPLFIGLYWCANTYQSIHYVLACIQFVFEVRWFYREQLWLDLKLQIQTVDSEIRSYWTSNTNTILTNTEFGHTIQTKTWINPNLSVPI